MLRRRRSTIVVSGLLIGSVIAAGGVCLLAQDRPDLSGPWQLNRQLSESAEAKLERLQSSQSSGHGPGRHGGDGFGGSHATQMGDIRALLIAAPASFILTQDGDRIVLTESDGRVRTFTANGQKVRVDGRDVRTRWDKHRLVSEVSLPNGKLTETYERLTNRQQLAVTTKVDVRGHDVTVRRVYDTGSAR
jgi:hypothetical protein